MVLSVFESENRPTLATAFVFILLAPGGLDVIPVLRTIASVIGSNRLFVLHFVKKMLYSYP